MQTTTRGQLLAMAAEGKATMRRLASGANAVPISAVVKREPPQQATTGEETVTTYMRKVIEVDDAVDEHERRQTLGARIMEQARLAARSGAASSEPRGSQGEAST